MKFILWAISENCYFWNIKMRLTEGSLKECAGGLSAGLGKGQAVPEVGTEVLSHCSVVNGTRQSCGMTAFGGHGGEGCHDSTWSSRGALAGSRCVCKEPSNHNCQRPWKIPLWLSLWIAGTAAESSGGKKSRYQQETPCEGDMSSVSQ